MSLMLEPAREGRLKLQNTSGKTWFGVGMGRPSSYPNQPASLIFISLISPALPTMVKEEAIFGT